MNIHSNKKIVFPILIILIFFALLVGFRYIQQTSPKTTFTTPKLEPIQVTTKPQQTEETKPTQQVSPENTEVTIENEIKAALIRKNGWKNETVVVRVTKIKDIYASGGVSFENTLGGGGYWFAALSSDGWKILADGNGSIFCDDFADFPDFPTDMVSECADRETGRMVVR